MALRTRRSRPSGIGYTRPGSGTEDACSGRKTDGQINLMHGKNDTVLSHDKLTDRWIYTLVGRGFTANLFFAFQEQTVREENNFDETEPY